jgi:glycosyltransferase involved in cell wall biosynthesis
MPAQAMVQTGGAPAQRPEAASRPKPRVCFVAPHAWPVFSRASDLPVVGGAEVQQAILMRLLAAHGYPVSLVSLDYGQREGTVLDGVTVHKAFAPDAGVPVLRFVHPRLSSMWRALQAADADVYYYRSAAMWLGVVTAFCGRHGRRSIYAAASDKDFLPDQGGQIRYARDRWLFRRGMAAADRIVVQNEAQRLSCRAVYGREALVIPSCYEPPAGARSAGERVIWVGTMHAGKRPEMLLELARRLPHRRFLMIGGPAGGAENPYYAGVRAAAASLPNVEFTGFLPLAEVERRFDEARVLVLTSEYEGMPNVFLQAWARGVPTVSTVEAGAPANRVVAGPDELEREVEALLSTPALWQAAAARCRRHFERTHSSIEALGRYARLLEELAT